MDNCIELSDFELLLPEVHEDVLKYLSAHDLKNLFLVSKTISSLASECKQLMQKVYYNYEGIEDFKSGRKYLALPFGFLQPFESPQFADLAEKFHHLEILRLKIENLMIDEAFDDAMNSLVHLKMLNLDLISFNCMSSTKSWILNKLECLEIKCSGDVFSPGVEITKKFESVLSIKKFHAHILGEFSTSQLQVICDFIASRSKLEDLKIAGNEESNQRNGPLMPKNVKLPIKNLELINFHYQTPIHCPEFILNCISTLERVRGEFSIATHRVLLRSLKLKDWQFPIEIGMEDIESLEKNRSIKFLTVKHLMRSEDALNALVQKCEALKILEVFNQDFATVIHSSKITTLKLLECCLEGSWTWERIKPNFPNIDTLVIEDLKTTNPGDDEVVDANEILKHIANQNWNLKYLKMVKYDDISISSLLHLLKECPTLKTLIIPKNSLKLVGNWTELKDYIKCIDEHTENGLQLYALSYKTNNLSFDHEDQEILTKF